MAKEQQMIEYMVQDLVETLTEAKGIEAVDFISRLIDFGDYSSLFTLTILSISSSSIFLNPVNSKIHKSFLIH